ncbi:MAG: adenosylmethionine decarboxylase [Myxococcota bacterium]
MTFAFFEGAEKKLELSVKSHRPSLRAMPRARWERVVQAAQAQVISVLSSDSCDAYLLSESSLFVFDSFVTMITCGRTRLVDAAVEILGFVDLDQLEYLIFERKNEVFPQAQSTSFFEDARRLQQLVEGRAVRFGVEHEHSVRMFHTTRPYHPEEHDRTLEVLMYGIDESCAANFRGGAASAASSVARHVGLADLLPDFRLDEHVFEPAGYSLNGLHEDGYVTIHVTPEREGSYASFETNHDFGFHLSTIVEKVVRMFRPESFDVIYFAPDAEHLHVDVRGYALRSDVLEPLSGYHVTFKHFFRPPRSACRAASLKL